MTQRRNRKATTRTPDCRTCGVCCISLHDQDVYCDVTQEDLKRMSPAARKHVVAPSVFDQALGMLDGRYVPLAIETMWREVKAGPLQGTSVCACVFLRGSVLHRTSCRIYENRPHACRSALKPGQKQCREARKLFLDLAERLANG